MPDVFVPLDTTFNSKYWQDLRRKNVTGQWVLSYIDGNRKSLLEKYPTFDAFKKAFVLDQTRMDEFFDFAKKQEVPFDSAGFQTSALLLKTVLTGSLAQNLYGSVSNYYEFVNEINQPFKEAIRAINDKTFERNKVAAN